MVAADVFCRVPTRLGPRCVASPFVGSRLTSSSFQSRQLDVAVLFRVLLAVLYVGDFSELESQLMARLVRVYGVVSWPQKTDKTGALVRKYCECTLIASELN
jgi:hypothetical protein